MAASARDVRAGGVPFRIPRAAVVVLLACLAIGWMLTSITRAEWIAFAISLGVAAVIFALRVSADTRR